MQSAEIPRLQFTLRDLFLVTGLTFLGICVLSPALLPTFENPTPCMHRVSAPAHWRCNLTITLGTLAGAGLGLWRANTFSLKGWGRAIRLIIYVGLVWLFVLFPVFVPNLVSSRCAVNESATIAACKTYAAVQDIFRRTDWDGDGVLEYAQTIRGNFSLYETKAGTGNLTLVDAAFAHAEGPPGQVQPKAGYFFKILTGQGPAAKGGRMSYLTFGADGKSVNMTRGYALVACPLYDQSGCNTFIINQEETVYQRDLGPETEKIFTEMTEFNPTKDWTVAD